MLKYNKNVLLVLLVAGFCMIGCVKKEEISTENKVTKSEEDLIKVVDEEAGNTSQDAVVEKENEKAEAELDKDDTETVTVDLTETNYSYYLSDIIRDPETEKRHAKKIFGFNVPEGYTEGSSESTTFEGEKVWSYLTVQDWAYGTGGSIEVGLVENTSYLEEFLLSGKFTEGTQVNMGSWWEYTLESMEKGGEVETPYGTAQVIYQYETREGTESDLATEPDLAVALFDVNNYKVIVAYSNWGLEVKGRLEKLLPEMLDY